MSCSKIILIPILLFSVTIPSLQAQDSRRADSLFSKGAALLQKGRYRESIPYLQQSMELYEQLPEALDNSAYSALWKGIAHYYLFEYENAIRDFESALEKSRKKNIKELVLSSSLYLAQSYYAIDDWLGANELYLSTLEIIKENNNIEYYPSVYEGLGNVNYAWGKYDSAEKHYLEALEYAIKSNVEESIVSLMLAMGKIHHARYEMDKAIEAYNKILERPNIEKSRFYGIILNSMGMVYFQKNETDTALEYYQKALEIAEQQQNVIEMLRLYIHIGGVLHNKENYIDALEYYNSALPLAEANQRTGDRSICLFNMGIAYVFLEDFDQAISYLLKSVELKEQLRVSASGKDRMDYMAAVVHVYQWLASVYLHMGKYSEAIDILENTTAKYLREQLNQNPNENKLDFNGVLNYQKGIPDTQAIIRFGSSSLPWHSILSITNKKINGIFASPEDLLALIPPSSYSDFQKMEEPHRGLTIIRPEKFVSTQMSFDDLIKYYRMLLVSKGNILQIKRIGRLLYDYLVEPVQNEIKDKDQLIIIPDGILAFLPFEALIMPNGKYLIEEYDIYYVQSLAVSQMINQRDYPHDRSEFLGIGGPNYENQNKPRSQSIYDDLSINEWNNLPGTLEELENILKLYKNGKTLTGDEASESMIKSLSVTNNLKKYKILHFATHGFVLPEQPDLSAIVLSRNNKDENDGYLNINEITNLEIEADFINLSACETGLGKIYGGEGVVGLSQAFLIAGANNLSVSLWQVSDDSTRDFMTGFYELVINSNQSYYKAMATMKRKFINSDVYNHPFYWAPFVFYGK